MASSRLAEIARDEAEAAELENPDEPEAPVDPDEPGEAEPVEPVDPLEPEQAPEPEGPQPPQTEAELEARTKAWDRERDRHFRELGKRDEYRYAASSVCPLCDGHGMFMVDIGEPAITSRRMAVHELLGGTMPEQYLEDEEAEMCSRCGGLGMLLTGSRVQNQETRTCPNCQAQGWRLKTPPTPQYVQATPQLANAPAAPFPGWVPAPAPPAVASVPAGPYGVPASNGSV